MKKGGRPSKPPTPIGVNIMVRGYITSAFAGALLLGLPRRLWP